jgi:hypothetical protein
MRKIERIAVSPADRERMERLVRGRNTPQKVAWRARVVLLASDGMTAEAIAAAVERREHAAESATQRHPKIELGQVGCRRTRLFRRPATTAGS